ncbi:MAG: hypothetical protein US48_C0001G0020 [Candidatus Levybacteria bacterium GW2011_GWA2_37_36]|nr:MAG: hypothetical protein US43_C0004G0021 [Candidatus Levybacteria bacterium GW2011_GWA1_37_16]KKQ34116.1 MAG: hypothetical protein US48_C0001G0020 [Candidatus Levybacteria bacterium GW2011_GWA2_37_36]KKQ38453.1 MAG: hypothetical protein US55_C0006G0008 [Candidatus Levybacteria bacterium GW2011_GWC2_37_7]KKQ42978.1 MAG: hypothetical protein US59_C0001G0020 [Candidatus Levybacteria bacterium GW2011_GWB1_37_8]OGH51432.1 MAG: hypothetical protein A3H17_02925 [Candidatus Levybacteria bacterium R
MKKLFSKKNLTILGIILVLIGIPLTIFILKNQTVFKSRASGSEEPLNVKITNITDTSFAITYQTESPSTGSISYGNDKKLGESELEDIDKEKGAFSPKKIHSISVKKLTSATKYYLTIISGSNTFLNNGAPFEATTGPNISSASAKSNLASAKQQTIKGKIVLPDGNALPDALVYLNAENSQLLSSTTTKNGEFSFSLKELRTADFSSYFDTNEDTILKIVATNGSLTSNVSASLSQDGSIPTITLSNDYDFTQKSSTTKSAAVQSSGFPSVTVTPEGNLKPKIISPKENQTIADQKPQFRGTSLPNEKVEIIIHSAEEITTQVTADSNGNWTYKPLTNLSPGVHTITIKTRDSQGILTTIIQSFTVLAAEAQMPTVTSSATPIAIPIPTPTASSPTIVMLTPLSAPTPTPPPILAPIESKGGLPPTGNSPTFLIIGGIITAISGLALFLLL